MSESPKPADALRTLPERAFRARARLVAGVFCLVCCGLAVRLLFLQVLGGGWYTDRALGQQLRDTVVPADRGRIYSADGVLLAANSSCWPRGWRRSWSWTKGSFSRNLATVTPTTASCATG